MRQLSLNLLHMDFGCGSIFLSLFLVLVINLFAVALGFGLLMFVLGVCVGDSMFVVFCDRSIRGVLFCSRFLFWSGFEYFVTDNMMYVSVIIFCMSWFFYLSCIVCGVICDTLGYRSWFFLNNFLIIWLVSK